MQKGSIVASVSPCSSLNRHASVQRDFVVHVHDLLNVIQKELSQAGEVGPFRKLQARRAAVLRDRCVDGSRIAAERGATLRVPCFDLVRSQWGCRIRGFSRRTHRGEIARGVDVDNATLLFVEGGKALVNRLELLFDSELGSSVRLFEEIHASAELLGIEHDVSDHCEHACLKELALIWGL